MRRSLILLVCAAACAADLPADTTDPPASVRERLRGAAPTRLLVAPARGGELVAERKVAGVWDSGTVALEITGGELVVAADADGAVTIGALQIGFASISVPPGVFGAAVARFEDVRVDLAGALRVPTAVWLGDDTVRLGAAVPIELAWTLTLDGAPVPLGSPALPPLPIELEVTG